MKYLLFIIVVLSPVMAFGQFPPGYRAGLVGGRFYYDNYDYNYNSPPPLTKAERYAIRVENLNAENRYNNRVIDLGLQKKNKQLEAARSWADMKKKEDFYRSKGYLPPKPTPKYIAYGKVYGSFAEFAAGPDYHKMVAEGEAKEEERRLKKEEERINYLGAVMESRRWNNMSFDEQQRHVNADKVSDTLKSDILSGRYSKSEVEQMKKLWISLQK
jgi:hypothetical protein